MLLDRARSQLLVVDVQDRLLPAMHEGERMVENCAILMQAAHRLGIPVTISEQYRKGLGATVARLDNVKGDAPVMEKMHFSCSADAGINTRIRALASDGRTQLIVCGIESHVCVLQSALGFAGGGLNVFVAADAVTSRKPESVGIAKERYAAEKVGLITTEMAVFEWLHVAGTPEFKDLSKLIK
ncbi:MAG: isochorismatase family protein [Rhodospirillaceae bacterium]|nr:isochorismatase family protein [Rhodospirillaceae bacterium]